MLVLDEPTNDLDMETLELLQEVIADYPGTVVIISHDRDFVDRTVTALLVFEDDGRIIPHAGGYSDYLARRSQTIARKEARSKNSQPKEKPRSAREAKLSFKDKHALETLPGEIAALEETIGPPRRPSLTPILFATNPDRFAQLAKTLEDSRADLSRKEEQWLDIEMRREEIEAAAITRI